MIDRAILRDKISGYLEGRLTDKDVYSWALFVAVSRDEDAAVNADPLIHAALQDLLEVVNADAHRRPGRKVLAYYLCCLAGDKVFDPQIREQLDKGRKKGPKGAKDSLIAAAAPLRERLFFLVSVYVRVFAVFVLAVNALAMMRSGFLSLGQGAPAMNLDAMKESAWQILYALVLLFPVRWLVRGGFLILSLPAVLIGAFYYWRISLELIPKLQVSPVFLVVILPFCAIPATLAVPLHFWGWRQERRRR